MKNYPKFKLLVFTFMIRNTSDAFEFIAPIIIYFLEYFLFRPLRAHLKYIAHFISIIFNQEKSKCFDSQNSSSSHTDIAIYAASIYAERHDVPTKYRCQRVEILFFFYHRFHIPHVVRYCVL